MQFYDDLIAIYLHNIVTLLTIYDEEMKKLYLFKE